MTDRSLRLAILTRLLPWLFLLVSWPALAFDLDDLQSRLGETSVIEGRFEQQRYLADLDTHLNSSGHFRYQRNERVVWVLEAPVQDRMVFTPDSASVIDESENAQSDRRRDQVAALFLQLLSGDWQALTERFDVTLVGDANDWRVTLTPQSQVLRERITRIELRGGRYLEHLELNAANDDVLDVRLLDQRPVGPTNNPEGDDASGD